MRKVWILVTLLYSNQAFYGQSKKSTISGVIKDSLHQPLVFATINLSRQSQPKVPIRNTYSNEKGHFRFNNVDTGNYFLDISHTGYIAKQEKIKVTSDQPVETGEIFMKPKNSTLKEVKVESHKPLIEQESDKVIFNVENDPMAKTETAMDILRKTPFVAVDGDDNVQVNGQSNFKVLLNGRETPIFAQNVKEALKGFPGALIVKIEVITSPSAKYDAEGVGGIINIITAKKTRGYNGSLSVNYNTIRRYNHSVNFSAKLGKWGLTFSHFLNSGGTFHGSGIEITTPLVQSPFKQRIQDGKTTRHNFGTFQNIELACELDSLNTISAYGGFGKWENNFSSEDIETTEYFSVPKTFTPIFYLNQYRSLQRNIGVDYIRKYQKKEKELSVRLNNEYGNDKTNNSSLMQLVSGQRDVLNINNNPSNQYTIQSDYILPLKKGKLESGGKIIMRKANSDFRGLIKHDAASNYYEIPGNNDYFKYEQYVYSAYSSYNFKVKNTNYRAGLRLEYTRVNGNFITSNTKIQQRYVNLLPNFLVNFKITKLYTLVISYNKRLQRPFIWNLNPFIVNTDSLDKYYGNPNLDAQIFHNIAFQNRFQKGNTFLGISLGAWYSGNSIVSYTTFDSNTGITSNTSDNIGKDLKLNINGSVNTKLTPDWNFSLNATLLYNHIENKFAPAQKNKGIGGNGNLNTSYVFTKKFSISSYAGFWRGPVTFQTKRNANYWYGIGATGKFLKEKLTASLTIENFINKNFESRTTTKDVYFNRELTFLWPTRNLRIGMNYNFGKLKEGVSKKKGVNNDDLMGKDSN